MDTSTFIAQLSGIVFAVLGLSMALNKKWTANAVEEIIKNQGTLWLAGLITVILGALCVVSNNHWTSGLPLFITVLGWLTLLKGALILLFPNVSVSYYKKLKSDKVFVWGGIGVFILAVLLLMAGCSFSLFG